MGAGLKALLIPAEVDTGVVFICTFFWSSLYCNLPVPQGVIGGQKKDFGQGPTVAGQGGKASNRQRAGVDWILERNPSL